jgi:hypothetical protein
MAAFLPTSGGTLGPEIWNSASDMSFLGFRLGLAKDNVEVLLFFDPFAHQGYRELVVTTASLSNQIDQLELAKEREIFFELLLQPIQFRAATGAPAMLRTSGDRHQLSLSTR